MAKPQIVQIVVTMTVQQANDLRLLGRVAETLTLPVLVMKTALTPEEAANIVPRINDLTNTLNLALQQVEATYIKSMTKEALPHADREA